MTASLVEDIHVPTCEGKLFARRWSAVAAAPSAAPIVLFHDSLGCVDLWRDFPAQLARATGRDVIAYDRLGFGRSDPHPGRLSTRFVHQEAAGGFHHVREALTLERFVAFGHSVGGGMAVACAAAWPNACEALITESAQAFVEDRTVAGIVEARTMFAQPEHLQRLARYHGEKSAWVLSAWIDTWLDPAFADWNLDEDLRRVRCPTLALHGDRDEFGSKQHPERIAALTGGRSVVLSDCGHVPHREHAPIVLDRLRELLARPSA